MRAIDGDRLKRKAQKVATEAWKMKTKATVEVILNQFIDWINDAPTIEPQRKRGKWIYGESEAGNDGYYCSKCGNFVPWKYDEYDIDFIKEFLFCNKCGAEMRNSVETARDIVHEAIDHSVWSDTVNVKEMHRVVDDKYADIRGEQDE